MACYDALGNLADGRPFWTGDFSGDGKTDILFYFPGDKNWWLVRFDGNGYARAAARLGKVPFPSLRHLLPTKTLWLL